MPRLRCVPGGALAILLVLALFLADAARPYLAFAPDAGGGGDSGGGGGGGGAAGGGGGAAGGGGEGGGSGQQDPSSVQRGFFNWGADQPPAAVVRDTTPPRLTVQTPAALQSGREARVTEAEAVVTGVATDDSRIKRVQVNGKDVPVDSRGRFSETLRLAPGANVLTFTAEDEHGNRAEARYTIIRDAPPAPAAAVPPPRIALVEPPLDSTSRGSQSAQKRSRTVLSSGGIEPVLDSGGAGHSVFAKALLEALEENRDGLDGQGLFARIRRPVVLNSPQTPEYSDIRLAGHDGGDFLFVRR